MTQIVLKRQGGRPNQPKFENPAMETVVKGVKFENVTKLEGSRVNVQNVESKLWDTGPKSKPGSRKSEMEMISKMSKLEDFGFELCKKAEGLTIQCHKNTEISGTIDVLLSCEKSEGQFEAKQSHVLQG